MPTIRIDDEVWQVLQKKAVPLEDTPNTVLRRLLRLDRDKKARRGTRAVGSTDTGKYRRSILQALVEKGGEAPVSKVLDRVAELVRPVLKPVDYDEVSTGEARWRNAARWERHEMAKEGLLRRDSRRGFWEITEKARQYLKSST